MTNLLKKTNRSSLSTRAVGFSLACLLVGISAIAYGQNQTVVGKSSTIQHLSQSQAKAIAVAQPLAFEANQGQADHSVKFLARARGYAAFLTSNESVVRINDGAAFSMKLRNGNTSPKFQGEGLQAGKSNYLLGNDRSKWIVGIPHYNQVRAKDVYPGIDAVYSGNERQIEYDYVVSPGVDPGQIRMDFDGATKVAITPNGDLELSSAAGSMLAHKPVLYQTINGQRKPVNGDFVLLAKNEAGFRVGSYDASQTLVIDPTLLVVANIGGGANDEGFGVGASLVGNVNGIVLTGRTVSVNAGVPSALASGFPVLNALTGEGQHSSPGGSWDAFVTKFTIDPTTGIPILAYSTYLGTPLDEAGTGAALDAAGNAYIAGYTNSSALLPTSPAPVQAFQGVYDAFVIELSTSGTYVAGTYVGGPGTTQAFSLALDPKTGNIVIGGLTTGLSPAPTGTQGTYGGGNTDGFVASFAPTTLAQVASTYLGGASFDQVNSVAVGTDGSVYAAGLTASGNANASGNFPTKSAIAVGNLFTNQAAFVTKLNNSTSLGSIGYSSIFGPGGEVANGVAVDPNGVAYVVGATKNPDFSTSSQPTGPGTCGIFTTAGTLPAASTSGGAIQWTGNCVDPGQTQGFLLALTSAGAIKYLDLQPPTAHDARNSIGVSTCTLNLTKNGGNFSSGNVCPGNVGSWNAVATDTDEEAYVAGQSAAAIGPPATYSSSDFWRFAAAGTLNLGGPVQASAANYGVAVINSIRQAYVIGTTTGAGALVGYLVPGSPNVIAPDSLVNNGAEDVSLTAIQYNDIFVTPTTPAALGPVGVGSAPAPFTVVQTTNYLGVPVSCTVPASTNAAFTIAALPSTGTYSITMSTANIGSFAGTATFNCGGDNGPSTVSFSGSVVGNLVVSPSAPLSATTQVNSGVVQQAGTPPVYYPLPLNNVGFNPQITVDVTTPAGTIPYKISQGSTSANWPTCALLSISGPSANATPATSGVSSFVITINSNCAGTLAASSTPYSETISVASQTSGLAPTVNFPFSLTVTSNGVLTQYLPNFIFGNSTTPQTAAFTVQAPNSSSLTYQASFGPWNNGAAPLPAQYASILAGQQGTIAPNGTAVVTVQINPNPGGVPQLAAGVYSFCYTVNSITFVNYNQTDCSNVYVGTGLGFVSPAGGVLNISVPAGYPAANITQPATIFVAGLANYASSPYSVSAPSGASVSFTPALPVGTAFAIAGANCSTYAQQTATNTNNGPWCGYNVTVDATSLVANTTYVGTITFKGATGVTANLTVNLGVTQYPQLSWVNNNGVALPSITFNGVVNQDATYCANISIPGYEYVIATGGVVPQVLLTMTPTNSWLGLGGNVGFPGSLNNNPGTPTLANPVQAPTYYGQNICVSASGISKPGTYVGSVTATGGGVGSTAKLQVNFIVSGTGTSNVGVFRSGFEWVLDANGNQLFDGTGPGLDLVEQFGGIAGDVPLAGDWSGSGTTKIGIYRASNGLFILDYNDNGLFDGCLIDRCYQFFTATVAGDVPVVGDWTGTGNAKVGIYRPSSGQWFLDTNGDGIYEAGVDFTGYYGGLAGDVPVVGDWTGTGTTKIGIFRGGFLWLLNTSGNGSSYDTIFPFGGIAGDIPVVGDWNASGTSKVGVFRLGFFWVLDTTGTHSFIPGVDQAFPFGGATGDVPVVGKWRKP